MKQQLLKVSLAWLFLTMLVPLTASADVEINEVNFPDESFRTYLLSQEYGVDGTLTEDEIMAITSLEFDGYSFLSRMITSFKGIEYFSALKTLSCTNLSQLTELDLSGCTTLTELTCTDNQVLTTLNVSGCTALTKLDCSSNRMMTILNLSGCTALTELKCYASPGMRLEMLDLSDCTALTYLDCNGRWLNTLDVTKNTELTYLDCGNNSLTSLDLSKNVALTHLNCRGNQLTALDLSKNMALTYLSCSDFASLDISKHTALETLHCDGCQLTSWDLSKHTALTSLSCNGCQLTSLDVSKNTALTYLSCSDNQLTTLDVSGNTALESLYCHGNQLTALDVSNNIALKTLLCYNNQLTSLNVSNAPLSWLWCSRNQIKGEAMNTLISSLPLKEDYWSAIFYLYDNTAVDEGNDCTKSQVAIAIEKGWRPMYNNGGAEDMVWEYYDGSDALRLTVDETYFPDANFRNALAEYFAADYRYRSFLTDGILTETEIRQITDIDVSGKDIADLKGIEYFTALQTLNCSNNQLTALDVSSNTKLYVFSCFDNQLTSLDVSNNIELERLYCYNNQLTSLELPKNNRLQYLHCYNNRLVSLDIADVLKETTIIQIWCYRNQIKGSAMDALIDALPQGRAFGMTFYVYDNTESDEGNVCTKAQVAAATDKGWRPKYKNGNMWSNYEGSDDDDASSIMPLDAGIENADAPVYSLSGQKVTHLTKKGVYIVGGRKIVVK